MLSPRRRLRHLLPLLGVFCCQDGLGERLGRRPFCLALQNLPGDHSVNSDSEESNANSAHGHPRQGYQQHNGHSRPYYSKFPYSSQSTPIRSRFQNGHHAGGGDTKSTTTRSSSTASENKITFNEDEYTRITTPRQDVLFKKGYLSKPKTYQTQTSTGNSTISTGNSTGNGTPDHQSADGTEGTDLEYESQFVFPNGFVDQNGIYYINSYEPYPPLVVYNAPYCYPEYPPPRSKRYSTDSLTESTSPHNEEASNHDPTNSGCENPVVNVVYTDCYYNNGNAASPTENGVDSEPRKVKKRRRRKASKPIPDGSTTSEESEAAAEDEEETEEVKTSLKPDAKEFVPRAYRLEPPQYVSVPNFIPLPPNFHPAFLPPGLPINFIPPDPKLMQTFNVIPHYTPSSTNQQVEVNKQEEEAAPPPLTKNNIDIAKIVSKLEEAAKEQRFYEKKAKFNKPIKRINNYRRHEVRRREDVNTNVNKSPEVCSKPTKNYASTLKAAKTPETPKKIVVEEKTPIKVITSNQWISVSRKKRKNKVEDEIEVEVVEEAPPVKDEEFESYDVNLLEDVVVASKVEEDNKPVPEVIEEVQVEPPQTPSDCEFDLLLKSLEEMELKSAKLAKKPRQTPKRVMVTDVDLSHQEKLEIHEVEEEVVEVVEAQVEKKEEAKVEESPEKKRKAKKKKSVKTQKTLSNSSSSVTLNNPDDSYDFLLCNNTLLEDEKTNVEISEELDKIIQRGMYNSLEEKIKSMNISAANDGFFKTISLTDKSDKQSLPSLSSLLKSTTNIFPKREVQLPELPTTTGSFLDVANVQEDPGIEAEYPITKAVKDWMTKARETTPEVEILKSPNTILKEIGDDVTVWSVSPNDSIDLEWDEEIPIGEDAVDECAKIKAELEEKRRNNGGFPKHANLPYRAICCSLM